ncbi:MAG: sugar ABC transporter permease [Clostridiales bacterium]|nr:sugar ABC transporter permease [Clostridiales bacterium]
MSPLKKFWFNLVKFFKGLPAVLLAFFKAIPAKLKNLGKKFLGIFVTIGRAAKNGDWKTRTSFVIMGFGQLARKQWLRGILYLFFEVLFVFFMVFFGWKYLAQMGSLGDLAMYEIEIDEEPFIKYVFVDNSLLILLYSLLTIFVMFCFVYVWYQNIRGNILSQELVEAKQTLPSTKDDLKSYADEQYHKTLLSIPMLGLTVFTILPIIFMIFVAFTNYDKAHMPPAQLFDWCGVENFKTLLGGGLSADSAIFAYTFREVLLWTIVWAFFATFTNYILGIIVAILINRKGIRFKKLWRTVLVMTIAIPQFVSLMLMSQLFKDQGLINNILMQWGWIEKPIKFLSDSSGVLPRITVIVVNIWIGIPFTMLMVSGILMNIPTDLYESARIDGAGPVKSFFKITLPYMLHVTTPYLITQFIGNLNNFNVIFLLTGGEPLVTNMQYAGKTDLLITWLYKLTVNQSQYGLASVIGIFTFIIVAVISLILYNNSKSVKNEEDFM